jgi:hypothetical protein
MIRIRNSPFVQALVCAGALLACTAAPAKDDVSVVAHPPVHYVSTEEAAVASCLSAFVQELFPTQRPVVHTVVQGASRSDLDLRSTGGRSRVEMQASVRSTGEVIARSQCIASRSALVRSIHTDIVNASLLATSTPQDLRVAALSH